MSAARRVVVGIENDDGSTVIWRLDADHGGLAVNEDFAAYFFGPKSQGKPQFHLEIFGYGERIDTDGPVDVQQLPAPPCPGPHLRPASPEGPEYDF